MDLVVLAAGMGSRFGGLKQIKPIDNSGNFIIDYSIYDAIKAGFDRVVFVIKRENLEDFENTIAKRIRPYIKVDYAFQDMSSYLPKEYKNIERVKPWGTAHAILCAKNQVKGNFAVINADDFYGRESFANIYNFLQNNENTLDNALVAFKVVNTLSNNGDVKRGVCKTSNNYLLGSQESKIRKASDGIFATILNENIPEFKIDPGTLVSMNLFGLRNNVFNYLEEGFYEFLNKNQNNLQTQEYFIPTILTELINKNLCKIRVLSTNEKWLGLTYKEDFDEVYNGIKNLRDKGIYPYSLWD